jgi:glutathione synthase/RimK-type ligase-like ATP-grasp enzyme
MNATPFRDAVDAIVLHENDEWLPPFRAAFAAAGLVLGEWHLAEGSVDLTQSPPDAVYFSRMSASAHTRGHAHAPALAAAILGWLERHGRTVLNGSRALAFETSKAAQSNALAAAGIAVPATVAAVGAAALVAAAERFARWPLIVKPNCGGKGLGIRRFEDAAGLAAFAADPAQVAESIDGIWLLQELFQTADGSITRAEFIDGRFHYAVRVATGGSFELCPAEACDLDERPRFAMTDDVPADLIRRLEAFLAANGIAIAGVEFARLADGRALVYDINTNTNYNPAAEQAAGVVPGPMRLAEAIRARLAATAVSAAAE